MKELIDKFNLSEETREAIGDEIPEDKIEEILEEHNSHIRDTYKEALANDDEFISRYRDQGHKQAIKEQIANSKRVLKKLGYKGEFSDDKGDIPPHVLIKNYHEELSTKMAGAGEGKTELEKQLTEMAEKYEALNSQIEEGTHPKLGELLTKLTALEANNTRIKASNWMAGMLDSNQEYLLPKSDMMILAEKKLDGLGWKIGEGEGGELTFLDGAGNQPRNEAKTQVLKNSEIMSILVADYVAKSAGGEQKKIVVEDKPKPFVQSHYEKRQEEGRAELRKLRGE